MLLQHSGKNVTEVAMDCGFENIPHFIRIFKQKFGYTPNSLRGKEAVSPEPGMETDIIPG
jgi:transcriptional regulator GlxA family with amidase domain